MPHSRTIFAFIIVSLLLPSIPLIHGLGGPLLTAVRGSTVDVDGIVTPAEWIDSQHVSFNWASNNGSLLNSADLWLKNNGTHLELAFAGNGTAQLNSGNDYYENQITFLFDHNNNGLVDNYDSLNSFMREYLPTGSAWQYFDSHYNATTNYYQWDSPQDGSMSLIHSNPGGSGRFTAEFSVPLVSARPVDFTLPVNGTIGFELLFEQIHMNGFNTVSTGRACWPAPWPNCKVPRSTSDLPAPNANGWATIVRSNDGAITDTTPPMIGSPTIQPHLPTSNDNVVVASTVTDDFSGVKNTTLTYTTDNWATVNITLSMTINQTNHQAAATIPAQQQGVRVQYYLVAYDYSGNKAVNNNMTKYYHYDVSQPPPPPPPPPSTQPAISQPVFVPVAPGPYDSVTVTVTVTDSQAQVSRVELYYTIDAWKTSNTSIVMLYDAAVYTAHGQIPMYPAGTHVQYYIVAEDTAGHRTIKNNSNNYYSYDVAPQSPTHQPGFWPTTATGTFLTLALLAALCCFILLFFVGRKKKRNRTPPPLQ